MTEDDEEAFRNQRRERDRRVGGLVRSESYRIRRNPSLEYTPPQYLQRKRLRNKSDHSIVYVAQNEDGQNNGDSLQSYDTYSSRVLVHSNSAPDSWFQRYDVSGHHRHHRTTSAQVLPPLPSLSETNYDEMDETQPLLERSSAPLAFESGQQDTFSSTKKKKPRKDDTCRRERKRRLLHVASTYLMDHQASRPPTLPPDYLSQKQLVLHWIRVSTFWRLTLALATVCLFLASCYNNKRHGRLLLGLTFFAVSVLAADMFMTKHVISGHALMTTEEELPRLRFSGLSTGSVQAFVASSTAPPTRARKSRSRWWALPLTVFLVVLSIETIIVVAFQRHTLSRRSSNIQWTLAWTPVVLFYTSPKARNALDAMNRVFRIVFKVLFIELFLIFTFGAVACQLYGEMGFEEFRGLAPSFLSMYEISTLVATPGLWMPVFDEYPTCAIFFVLFLITSVFYMHSLVLSVVFQSYMEALMIIRDHAAHDREEALRLAFQTLYRIDSSEEAKEDSAVLIKTKNAREVFIMLRPTYGREKIKALVDIVDPSHSGYVDYNSFRYTVPKAMITSVRTTRHFTTFSVLLEAAEVFLAIGNLVYVVLASSMYEPTWWMKLVIPFGGAITVLCTVELLFRLIYSQKYSIPDALSPDVMFDGLAFVGIMVSVVGLVCYNFELERSLDWLVTGRAIDMMRVLRLAREARGIVRRSGELLPHVVGPVVLLVTALHMLTYLGMAIWGGTVVVGSNSDLAPFYDHNNFNTYTSGLMTMFNLLVANDWHLIAQVFIVPSSGTNKLVYPFFIGVNLIIVSILLNVLTAFFVGGFVTKTSWRRTSESHHATKRSITDSATVHSTVAPLRPISVRRQSTSFVSSEEIDDNSTGSNDITISEREDFDDVIKTVVGKGDNEDDDVAKYCCHLLELFETLGGQQDENNGYLVSCQQSMSRYGNERFQQLLNDYMGEEEMHVVIDEMQTELTRSQHGHEISVHRMFQRNDDQNGKLQLTASLVKEGSSVALFIAKIVQDEINPPGQFDPDK